MQDIPQQTRLAKIGRELHDGICQKPTHLAPRAALLRVLLVRGDAAAERLIILPAWLFQRRHSAVAPLPQQIDGSIRPDARKPGAKIVRRLILFSGELLEPHPRFEQSFLAYILGIGSVTREATRAAVQRWNVRRNHLGKRVAISAPRLSQQLPAGQPTALETESEGCRAHPAVKMAVQAPPPVFSYLASNEQLSGYRNDRGALRKRPLLGRSVAKAVRDNLVSDILTVSVQAICLFTYVPRVWCRFAALASLAGPRLSRMSRPKVVGLYGFCR